ncbi:hypothetical protein QE152_g25053 [Popillia japonica]|uniref:C2H2-type domain-containing protein n=1 Tax=Popillia japonica TaxID=7064 RepID=A0AAW1K4K0_POPJA
MLVTRRILIAALGITRTVQRTHSFEFENMLVTRRILYLHYSANGKVWTSSIRSAILENGLAVQETLGIAFGEEDESDRVDTIFIAPPNSASFIDEDCGDEAGGGELDNLSKRQLLAGAKDRNAQLAAARVDQRASCAGLEGASRTAKKPPPLLRSRTLPAIVVPGVNILQAQLGNYNQANMGEVNIPKELIATHSWTCTRFYCEECKEEFPGYNGALKKHFYKEKRLHMHMH